MWIRVRQANIEDVRSVSEVYVNSWRTTYYGLVPNDYLDALSYEEAEKKWLNFFANERNPFIYVAVEDQEKIIGFASGMSCEGSYFEGELFALYIAEEYKGLGIGRELVSAIAKHFIDLGIYSMMVWVMKQNKSGLGFYERLGGQAYAKRTSTFGKMTVEDIAYGWKDVSKLCVGK